MQRQSRICELSLKWSAVLATLLALGVSPIAHQAVGQASGGFVERVGRQLDQLFADPAFVRGVWGVQVKSLDSGEVLYQKNPYKYLMPASNMKLPTAAAAHRALGLDFRFRTLVTAQGKIARGALQGDLLVIGGGDPSLGARLSSPDAEDLAQGDPLKIFKGWAGQLKQKGIRRIEGDLVGDARIFDPLPLGMGWSWDDVGYGYSAEISGLQFNENVVMARITPARRLGNPAQIEIRPDTSYLSIDNRILTVPAHEDTDLRLMRLPGTNQVRLWGSIPLQREPLWRSIAVTDPPRYFVTVLRETLQAEGIQVRGDVRVRGSQSAVGSPEKKVGGSGQWAVGSSEREPETRNPEPLIVHQSPPLGSILKVLLKVSQNLYAETMVKTLAPAPHHKTYEDGRKEIVRMLTRMGVPPVSYILRDGSGLSRYNFLSADMLVRLLEAVWRHPERDQFLDLLPLAGVDGTLSSRMKGSAAEKNVRAKTGTLANVRALSGYVTTKDGETLAFAMIANNFNQPMRSAEYLQDSALHFLASLSRRD